MDSYVVVERWFQARIPRTLDGLDAPFISYRAEEGDPSTGKSG